ncbi:FG-GAP-like repeat-containing protein [Micromonospora sp. HM5-17]|jgi:hypothetical protein|uniref:FG-GAP-like repeat-containing protein n=1 Tax=Micromonospora sp. HM5-17 TaxID=2487710 RepID=UPI000F4703AE|nr:FG-GAP-like repeat-containing protein [Micromonospora sp. HM5-17]ROT31619.1 VCBS repeat-containing protein [Micromonospora sp. HM5-17]
MFRRRTAALTVLILLAVVTGAGVLPPVPSWAAGRGEQILGDVNGDGFTDRITLGVVEPDLCAVIVEYGTASGTFRPPVASVYLRPGGTGPGARCPDLGVTVDLDSDQRQELVVAWYPGPPPITDVNLMVLDDDFQPSFGLTEAVYAPYFLGTADFNGDGRLDVYSVTDQGQGIETYLNLGNGTLTRGPVAWCAGPLSFHLPDLDRDNASDLVSAYTQRCLSTTVATGVVVVLDDGTQQELQTDPLGLDTWTASVVNANGDRFHDIRTVSRLTSEVDYFINTGTGQFVESPRATPDTATVVDAKAVSIAVLANDYVTSQATVTITTPPRYGTAQVTSNRQIVYRPRADHGTTDRFTYQVTEGGRRSAATVHLRFTG